jgi:hypothetical protein
MFVWDPVKDAANLAKHGVSFELAKNAFRDPNRVIALDVLHSDEIENRYFCFAKVEEGVLTVRFTWRNGQIRIFGAGFWRQGRKRYEQARQD